MICTNFRSHGTFFFSYVSPGPDWTSHRHILDCDTTYYNRPSAACANNSLPYRNLSTRVPCSQLAIPATRPSTPSILSISQYLHCKPRTRFNGPLYCLCASGMHARQIRKSKRQGELRLDGSLHNCRHNIAVRCSLRKGLFTICAQEKCVYQSLPNELERSPILSSATASCSSWNAAFLWVFVGSSLRP